MFCLSLFLKSIFSGTFTLLSYASHALQSMMQAAAVSSTNYLPGGLFPSRAEHGSDPRHNRTRHFQSQALCLFSLAQFTRRFWNNSGYFFKCAISDDQRQPLGNSTPYYMHPCLSCWPFNPTNVTLSFPWYKSIKQHRPVPKPLQGQRLCYYAVYAKVMKKKVVLCSPATLTSKLSKSFHSLQLQPCTFIASLFYAANWSCLDLFIS